LSRINEDKPYALYEALFGTLLSRCQGMTPGHGFRFKSPLYSLDASTIDLCLAAFPWADFRTTKGAIKLHVGLNHDGYLPEFITVTQGRTSDIEIGRTLAFPKGSMVAIDRGYTDYAWYNQLTEKGIFFVTRLKSNAQYRVVSRRAVLASKGLTCDQTIEFTGIQTARKCPILLRRIGYRDPETGKHYVFLTNHFKPAAKTIADIYKARWQVELFFKWIKQNLKIKTFLGTSKNAVMTQIWIALCVYLLLAFIKFQSKLKKSMQQILRLLQLNLFEKRDLMALLRGDPLHDTQIATHQMALW
jgi:putative transposase